MRRFSLLYVVLLLGLVTPQVVAAGVEETEFFVRISTPNYVLTPDGLAVPGYVLSQQPGAPALPLYGTVVELPPTGQWSLQISSLQAQVLSQQITVRAARTPVLARTGGNAIDELATDNGVATIEEPDPVIYGRNAFYPASVAVAGTEQWQRGKRLLPIQVFPLQYNPVTHEVMYHPEVTITIRMSQEVTAPANTVDVASAEAAPRSQTSANELGALLLRTGQRGMHRLTYQDLSNAGVPVADVNPDSFLISYLGQPVRIQVTGSGDAHFDPGDLVIFYAEPYSGRWMPTNVYRFSYGTDPAPASSRMTTRTGVPTGSEPVVTTGKQTQRIEVNAAYYSDFEISTEADHIFDNPIYPTSSNKVIVQSRDIVLDDPVMSGNMTVRAQLYGGLAQAPNPDVWAKVQVNSHDVVAVSWDGRVPYSIAPTAVPMSWLDQATNKLNFVGDLNQLPALSSYYYYVDYAEIVYPAALDAEGDRIEIQHPDTTGAAAEVQVTGFSTPAVKAYDVRDPRNPVQLLQTASAPVSGATQITFWDSWPGAGPEPAYSLTTDAALLAPAGVEVDTPSSLKSFTNYADYIAIVHHSLSSALQPLLDRRAAQGIRVAEVDVQDIYDEFNYGQLHQNAIRDFLKYAYQNWNQGGPRPKYVVLVGDATPDYKKQLTSTLQNLVPAFLINVDPWIIETAADNRFVTFDGLNDILPEMTIGRISAQTATELTNYVSKVIAYEDQGTTLGDDWQNRVVYVGDDDQNYAGNFHALSEDIRLNWLPPSYQSPSVYYNPNNSPPGGYPTAGDMRTNIKAAFNNGAIFLQWFGHASKFRWGGDYSMWNINDPPTLSANTRTPFVAAFSCWDGYFINMDSNYSSLAEKHLFQQGRGSIGGLSPSGKHVGNALSILDQGLTKSIFQDRKGVIGDAVDAARVFYFANSASYLDVLDTSILFGDPVLRLRLPGPLSAPDSPSVSIQRNGATNADLLWEHVGSDAAYYEVYRSTEPYPVIGQAPTNRIRDIPAGAAYGSGYEFVITDNGTDQYPADGTLGPIQVIGDPAVNHFWVVQSRSSSGQTSGVATRPDGGENIVGEFDFALIKGN